MFIRAVVGAALLLGIGTAAAQTPNPRGIWLRGDGNARVEFAPCGAKTCATNLWIKDTSKGEAVGDRLIMDVTPDGGNVFKGTATDPKRNLQFAFTMTVEPASMVTRGCLVGGLICKSENWTRAK